MGDSERQPLLRPERNSFAGLPTSRTRGRGEQLGNVGLSVGGGSWNRRIAEFSPPSGRDIISSSLDSRPRRKRGTNSINIPAEPTIAEGSGRRPYHYRSQTNMSEGTPLVGRVDADPVEEVHYRRYQYYTRLQNQAGMDLDLLNIPDHVVPTNFYTILLPGLTKAEGKQSSIITIFSLWNTMLGTSLLSMPWALQQAGILMGIAMMILLTGISLYTAYRILQVYTIHSRNNKISEFSDLCGLVLGRWAEFICTIFSVLAILGAAIVYWVLMSNFLYSTVQYAVDLYAGVDMNDTGVYCPNNFSQPGDFGYEVSFSSQANFTQDAISKDYINEWGVNFDRIWGQYTTVPLFLIIILFPLVNLKSATFFTKFNALGTVSICFITTSVLYRCYEWGLHADFKDTSSPEYVPLYANSFPSLTGILALGLFIHNAIITIMSNNEKPENNGRDMSIGYMLVIGTYMLIGTAFYLAFPLPKGCIEDNLLNNFMSHDGLNVAAKVFLFLQMTTVFPLIMYILRISVLFPIFRQLWPGLKYVCLLNLVIIIICVSFAIFLPKIGTIIRYSGAACGMSMIFTLPVLLHLAQEKRAGKLTYLSMILHGTIIAIGAANFLAQFFI